MWAALSETKLIFKEGKVVEDYRQDCYREARGRREVRQALEFGYLSPLWIAVT
jgi:hypothetical protein